MNRIENVSRRKFLQQLGLGSSALVLGVQLPALLQVPKAFAGVTGDMPASLQANVYVEINADNSINVVVHRSEMGQGVRTSLPMIVADELEADWQQINIVQALADKKYGSQNTDGSRSVRQFYQPLREAGASARMMLEQAAAQKWQLPVHECVAKQGKVYHQGSDKVASFGELVAIAATLPVPDKAVLHMKTAQQFRYIGNDKIKLVDGHDIVTGKAQFGFDIVLPDMAIAVIARPPVLAATVKSYDASLCKKIPGVIDVVPLDALTEPPLFKPLGGIAVIAENTWAALEGRKALQITWQDSEHSSYQDAGYKQQLKQSCEQADVILRNKGDVDKALASAAKTITADYYVPALVHASMEPPAATAVYRDGAFEIWTCTQTPQSAQQNVAQITGTAVDKVTVHVTLLGGAFGRKSKPDYVAEAAILAKRLQRPVKVLWTREDDIRQGYYHAVSYQQLTAAVDQHNKVQAWRHHVALPTIASTFSKGADVISFEANLGLVDMPFDIASVRCAAGRAKAHTRIGWLRSVTNINQAFAASSFADELAANAGADSRDYLLKLLGTDRQLDFSSEQAKYDNYGESLSKFPVDTKRYKAVLNKAAEIANWGRKLPAGEGLGIAVHRSFATYVACVAHVAVRQGKVQLQHIYMAVDCGTVVNPERVRAQMEGAAVFGTSIAFYGEISAKDGAIIQGNYHDYPVARMHDSAPTTVAIIDSDAAPGGVGEPGVPPVAPAICNAIFAATGQRYRELPLTKHGVV